MPAIISGHCNGAIFDLVGGRSVHKIFYLKIDIESYSHPLIIKDQEDYI